MNRTCSRGFTLLEVLIVVIIMAILASILLPAFAKTRELARRKKRDADLRTIPLAIRNYKHETGKWPIPGSVLPPPTLTFVDNNGDVVNMVNDMTGLPQEGKLTLLPLGDYNVDGNNTILDPWGKPYRFIFKEGGFGRVEFEIEAQ